MKPEERVKYQVGIDTKFTNKKQWLLFDEIDAPMFDDLELFYNNTKAKNLKIICLTATPYDGNEEGNELKAIQLMQYKLFYSSEEAANMSPTVNETFEIRTKEAYEKLINEKKKIQPVLIFANHSLFGQLAELDGVHIVTSETPSKDLETMDVRTGQYFPVMMISNDYGTRGINFRAPNSQLGICMIVGGSFGDRRSRVQGLLRVGRYTDKCHRIQDKAYPEIDAGVNA